MSKPKAWYQKVGRIDCFPGAVKSRKAKAVKTTPGKSAKRSTKTKSK